MEVSMGKEKTGADAADARPDQKKPDWKPSASKRIKLEILRENWINLNSYIKGYNKDSLRMSPKTDVERVIHEALAAHLASSPKG
jgi:hypothetical protein